MKHFQIGYLVFMQEGIFEIVINSEGRELITRLSNRIKKIFVVAMATTLAGLVSVFVQINRTLNTLQTIHRPVSYQLVVSFGSAFLELILFIIQAYYFYAFSTSIRKGLDELDSSKFNRSFSYLNTNVTFAFISVIFSLAVSLFTIFYIATR